MLTGEKIQLTDMLNAREERANLQREFIGKFHLPLVSLTLNIPGEVKTNADLRALFFEALSEIEDALAAAAMPIAAKKEKHAPTGDEAILSVRAEAAALKQEMTAIEENHPLGRLMDIDVIDVNGEKLSRAQNRRCLLCGRPAQDCARSRRHSAEELSEKIAEMLRERKKAMFENDIF